MATRPGRPARPTTRREGIRRTLPKAGADLREVLLRPEVVYGALACLAFVLLTTLLLGWSRDAFVPTDGQVARETLVVETDFTVEDAVLTEQLRRDAREGAPSAYVVDDAYLRRVRAAIGGLPRAVAGKASITGVESSIIDEFALTDGAITALQRFGGDAESVDPRWLDWTDALVRRLWREVPILEATEYQVLMTSLTRGGNKIFVGVSPDADDTVIPRPVIEGEPTKEIAFSRALARNATDSSRLRDRVEDLALRAGFPVALAPHVATRIAIDSAPTARFAADISRRLADAAATAVEPAEITSSRGDLIANVGDVLTRAQVTRLEESRAQSIAARTPLDTGLRLLGLAGLVAALTVLLTVHAAGFYPRIARNPVRLATLLALLVATAGAAAVIAVHFPRVLPFAAFGFALVTTIVVALSYDRRLALACAGVFCVLLAVALRLDPGFLAAAFVCCAVMAASLRELRHRGALVRAATWAALVGSVGIAAADLATLPVGPGLLPTLIWDAALVAAACHFTGFVALGVLPTFERVFDVTTGLTLSELRDPRQPLLREMQQRAPGTYNHSLQIANIAEAAAETIGADGLLVYVGALYHDIGKINKPEYFIENQGGGPNKHAKLSPAMSLLVIVGHVKDGIELAREHNLPRVLHHFIESHHGTTLVEYFFHAARTKASEDGGDGSVDEFEFRYPGPKPRTREAAILMLCDAVESATRAMGEPTPSRIEALVRQLSRKRLADGQFDECPLTFRELRQVEDSVIKTLCAIYHGRISYPGSKSEEPATATTADTRARAETA